MVLGLFQCKILIIFVSSKLLSLDPSPSIKKRGESARWLAEEGKDGITCKKSSSLFGLFPNILNNICLILGLFISIRTIHITLEDYRTGLHTLWPIFTLNAVVKG